MNSGETEIEDAPSSYKSDVWQHFGFPVTRQDDGKKITDKTQTVCKNCKTMLPYTTSNTSNMMCHLKRHHNNKTSANSCDKKGERKPNIYTTQFCCNMVSVKCESSRNNQVHRSFYFKRHETIFCGRKCWIS